jgi:hypothetical protein
MEGALLEINEAKLKFEGTLVVVFVKDFQNSTKDLNKYGLYLV